MDLKFKNIDKKAILLWRINGLILTLILGIISLLIYKIFSVFWGNIGFGVVGITGILCVIIHPFFEYKQWKYGIFEDKIEILHGIYFNKHIIVPISKIQYLNISQGPIQKKLNLSSVQIFTAGNEVEIEAISYVESKKIVNLINDVINNNEVAENERE